MVEPWTMRFSGEASCSLLVVTGPLPTADAPLLFCPAGHHQNMRSLKHDCRNKLARCKRILKGGGGGKPSGAAAVRTPRVYLLSCPSLRSSYSHSYLLLYRHPADSCCTSRKWASPWPSTGPERAGRPPHSLGPLDALSHVACLKTVFMMVWPPTAQDRTKLKTPAARLLACEPQPALT